MYQLTHHQAQNIVDKMMKDIPYNINIMDQAGTIIGSGNKERIGTLHHGAVEAIKQKKIVEITTDEKLVKKGINLPIELNGYIVGVVGISGKIEETRPFGNLVKSAVILLIEQSIAIERENAKNNLKQQFFSLVTDADTVYTNELIEQALTYGIYLKKPSIVTYVEFPYGIPGNAAVDLPAFKLSNHLLCLILQEADQRQSLENQIRELNPDALISFSEMNDTIHEGLRQAKSALQVLKGVITNEKTICYSQCAFIADMSMLYKNNRRLEQLTHLLENNDELIKTLQIYLSCNLNANETARQLIIHRNTLNYRLNRIYKMTGKNPHHIMELVELIFMLIHRVK